MLVHICERCSSKTRLDDSDVRHLGVSALGGLILQDYCNDCREDLRELRDSHEAFCEHEWRAKVAQWLEEGRKSEDD